MGGRGVGRVLEGLGVSRVITVVKEGPRLNILNMYNYKAEDFNNKKIPWGLPERQAMILGSPIRVSH